MMFSMQPWNKNNWLEWKHQFQVWLAILGELEDEQKTMLFLDCLGQEGRSIALKLFPQLGNFHLTADASVTFDQVWWQFNEHCWTRYDTPTETSKDTDSDRMRLQEICNEAMDKVRIKACRLKASSS